MALLGLLGSMSVQNGGALLARQRLEAATRSVEQGINRARAEATQRQGPCGMRLGQTAWLPPSAGSALEPCFSGSAPWPQGVVLQHNFPDLLRFTGSGLVLDGGLVVFSHPASKLRPCVVLSLPLGVTRQGEYAVDPLQELSSASCLPPS